jgi:hypothetical protein
MKKETSTSTGNQAQSAPTSFPDPVTILRTCDPDLKSFGGFQWPESGYIEAPDFQPTVQCGNGLHGLLDGRGDWELMDWSLEAKALIVETDRSQLIELSGKVKFQSAIVKKVTSLGIALCEVFCNALNIRKEVDEIMSSAQPTKNSKTNSDSYAQVANSGDSARVANSGTYARVANSGTYAQVANSGDSARVANSGTYAQVANSGDSARVANSGDSARVANSGTSARVANSGDSARVANSGDSARVANSGDSAQVANSGDSARVANSGTYARVANSGTYARLESTGKNSVIVSSGKDATASGVEGCAIALTWWTKAGRPRIAVAYVGKDGIKPNTFYKVNASGKFVEVRE